MEGAMDEDKEREFREVLLDPRIFPQIQEMLNISARDLIWHLDDPKFLEKMWETFKELSIPEQPEQLVETKFNAHIQEAKEESASIKKELKEELAGTKEELKAELAGTKAELAEVLKFQGLMMQNMMDMTKALASLNERVGKLVEQGEQVQAVSNQNGIKTKDTELEKTVVYTGKFDRSNIEEFDRSNVSLEQTDSPVDRVKHDDSDPERFLSRVRNPFLTLCLFLALFIFVNKGINLEFLRSFEISEKVHIDIPCVDMILQMPYVAKVVKDSFSTRKKGKEQGMGNFNLRCSTNNSKTLSARSGTGDISVLKFKARSEEVDHEKAPPTFGWKPPWPSPSI